MYLSELKTGESAIIIKVLGHGGFRRRILEMGFVRGQKVTSLLNAPLKDPIKYKIMDYEVSLRRSEARMIEIEPYSGHHAHHLNEGISIESSRQGTYGTDDIDEFISDRCKEINIALVGNPNSGKTSLFNALSGGHEHVGNYSGVTVDAKVGHFNYGGYKFNITDLPGTYALTAYSPEEIYVRQYLIEHTPDVILNSVVASNLERNLYLTSELIDINLKTVVALNMFDEHRKSGAQLDYLNLGKLTGVPMVPVVAKAKEGLEELLNTIIDVYENGTTKRASNDVSSIVRHIHIKYSPAIEKEIALISKKIKENDELFPKMFPPRYWSVKLLEGDKEVEKILHTSQEYGKWTELRDAAVERVKKQLGEDVESAISDEKYGFISGALKETYVPGSKEQNKNTTIIDSVVTNKVFGFPIFLFLMWLMFNTTFSLGAYPQEWIESLVAFIGDTVSGMMSEGALKDLVVNGIIGGVGSVIVFLPNILILYLFISLMEDSGYMARAAFIMDKLMHKIGLHGKSFIPLIMGFGCNVPAIMSARTIESRSSRLITILINPFMSCSARLPVYILLAGIFFPGNSGSVLMLLYLTGILAAVLTAKLLRRFLFKEDETPFVMELPPYRVPTLNATLQHMWEKCAQYLKKIGSVILFASIIIWFLGYYPRPSDTVATDTTLSADSSQAPEQHTASYLEQIGRACEPVIEPLGLNWKAGVAFISGAAAKEIIVSTLGVLYAENDNTSAEVATKRSEAATEEAIEAVQESVQESADEDALLKTQLLKSGDFTTASALSFMVFALLYFPCIATLAAIASESGSWKWAAFSFVYSCSIAWLVSFVVYNICMLF
ncbi:MAG: ferrous iron transport protein B [Bacteroidales bacterium]|nr:ferrous iron transport protein B [Bacteroidales bacterium]